MPCVPVAPLPPADRSVLHDLESALAPWGRLSRHDLGRRLVRGRDRRLRGPARRFTREPLPPLDPLEYVELATGIVPGVKVRVAVMELQHLGTAFGGARPGGRSGQH